MSEHMQLSWCGFLQEARFKERGVGVCLSIQYSRWNPQSRKKERTGQKARVWINVPAAATSAIEFMFGLKDKGLKFESTEKGADIWKGPAFGSGEKSALIEVRDEHGMSTETSISNVNGKTYLNFSSMAGAHVSIAFASRPNNDGSTGGGDLKRGMGGEDDAGGV